MCPPDLQGHEKFRATVRFNRADITRSNDRFGKLLASDASTLIAATCTLTSRSDATGYCALDNGYFVRKRATERNFTALPVKWLASGTSPPVWKPAVYTSLGGMCTML